MQQLAGTQKEDIRYDFLLFLGRMHSGYLPSLCFSASYCRYHLFLRSFYLQGGYMYFANTIYLLYNIITYYVKCQFGSVK